MCACVTYGCTIENRYNSLMFFQDAVSQFIIHSFAIDCKTHSVHCCKSTCTWILLVQYDSYATTYIYMFERDRERERVEGISTNIACTMYKNVLVIILLFFTPPNNACYIGNINQKETLNDMGKERKRT